MTFARRDACCGLSAGDLRRPSKPSLISPPSARDRPINPYNSMSEMFRARRRNVSDMLFYGFIGRSRAEGGEMSDGLLGRLVVTVAVIIGFTLWLASEKHRAPGCRHNCPTDISASRKDSR